MEGKIRPDIILMNGARAEREMCVTNGAQRTFEDLKQKSLHSHFCLLAVPQPTARLCDEIYFLKLHVIKNHVHLIIFNPYFGAKQQGAVCTTRDVSHRFVGLNVMSFSLEIQKNRICHISVHVKKTLCSI